jgi:hypothetical protein
VASAEDTNLYRLGTIDTVTTFPNSPPLLKAGLVLFEPTKAQVVRVISFLYNPESLSRSFQIRSAGEGGERSEALRLTGPAMETIKLDAVLDATDQMEAGDATVGDLGIHPQLAALEMLVHPSSANLQANNELAKLGTLEILPEEALLTLFVFGKNRVLPVRVAEISITEEAFDPNLNPLRAKVSLGLRVLGPDDVGFEHKAGSLFMSYLQQKEALSLTHAGGSLTALGLTAIP